MRQFYQLGIENIGGSPKNKVYSDFQTISSAIEILDKIFCHKLNFKVVINNLGGQDSISDYNKELKTFFSTLKGFSTESKNRLKTGNAIRILDTKNQ